MIDRIFFLSSLVAGSFLAPFLTAETGTSEDQRHQIRQETDNKIREMANETYVNRVKAE